MGEGHWMRRGQRACLGLQSALEMSKTIERVQFDVDAYRAWESAYDVLTEGATGIFGSMTARAEAQVVRLSTLYALLDSSNLIRMEHLKAAQEVWAYCEDACVTYSETPGRRNGGCIFGCSDRLRME